MITTPVQYVDVPTVNDIHVTVPKCITEGQERKAIFNYFYLVGSGAVTLTTTPFNPHWVEVWLDGWRLLNTDTANPEYIVSENTITFTNVTEGNILVVIDTQVLPYYGAYIIHSTNVQHQQAVDTFTSTLNQVNYVLSVTPPSVNSITVTINGVPKTFNTYSLTGSTVTLTTAPTTGSTVKIVTNLSPIGLRSEPVALTQPQQGYVRLTTDRKYLVYVPNMNFAGKDTFSWTLMTQNGQLGAARCAQITVE